MRPRHDMPAWGRAAALAVALAAALAGSPLLTGCATQPVASAPLVWDSETGGADDAAGRRRHAFFDRFMSFGSTGFASTTPPLDQLAWTPRELNDAILDALSHPVRMAPLIARGTSGTSRMSLTPQGGSTDAAVTLNDAADAGADTWGITSSNDGQIVTDWQAVPGREAGVLWWKKRYDTEARHIITVKQAMRSEHLSSYSIQTEVRERPSPSYAWAPADPELGRAAFMKIKARLWNHILQKSIQKKAAK